MCICDCFKFVFFNETARVGSFAISGTIGICFKYDMFQYDMFQYDMFQYDMFQYVKIQNKWSVERTRRELDLNLLKKTS